MRNQDNDVSNTQDDEFSIPTTNGYHVYTTLGGVANSPQGYGLKTPRGRGQQPLGVGANNPSNYNHMNYNQVELDSSDAKTSKGVVAQKEPPREDIDQLCTLIKDHAASQSTAKPPSISQEWRRQARLLLDKDGVPLDQAGKFSPGLQTIPSGRPTSCLCLNSENNSDNLRQRWLVLHLQPGASL